MKLAWMFCLLLAGKLSSASAAGEEGGAPAESNLGSSGYMMAFPMDDDQVAEESAQEAVKMLAESLVSDSSDDDDDQDEKKPEEVVIIEGKKEDQTEQPEPMRILEAELDAEEEAEKSTLPQRPFFKRPKIDELRKILGFPPPEGPAAKSKPLPQEKPKVFQGLFNKPKPKLEMSPQPSPLGGLQFNLRREDRMRPFGFPMLPLKRDDSSFRPFGIPDLVQAASSLIRRAIVDDNSENDISKDDKEEEENANDNEPEDNDEEEEDDDSLMIVPIPDPKEGAMDRPPLFRRLPIPFPFPMPRPMPQNRPRLPFPPLTPVAFFLPIAQQIMQNIRHAQPRSQPPMVPMAPMHPVQNLIPLQSQVPIIPMHHPIQQQQQQLIPLHHSMIPVHQPVQQQFVPLIHVPQASFQVPILTPLLPNMQRPMMRQMPRRMPVHAPQPQIQRRLPFPNPMSRVAAPQPHPTLQQQFVAPMVPRRPLHAAANTRPMHRVVRPPMHPVHPVLIMMPFSNMHMPMMAQQQQQVPVFHKPQPQHFPMMPQQMHMVPQQRHFLPSPEEERVVFLRPDQEEQDDDQEVLILVPSDEVEVAQRPPVPQQFLRQIPSPVANPLQRIRLLRDLLMARQANRQAMTPQDRAARVVEIVQQQLRIFPAHHQQMHPPQFQRADPSELHPVYVPFPGPQ